VLAVGSRFTHDAPAGVRAFFESYRGSSARVSEGLAYMHANDANAEAAARYLLTTHPELLEQWLDGPTAARVGAALSE